MKTTSKSLPGVNGSTLDARETPFKIALSRVKPKDKDSGDVERFRLRQVTNRDGRAISLDRLTLRLQTLPRREGYWLDTGMLKTG